ncbi:MAG: cupin domain-containing protein [Elusimicrobia bacterium]|nr:cupin domain-containing protein [Elusimicrobiota bacterium]
MDMAAVEKDWRARGFSFGIWEDPAGQVWENYEHNEDELFMVVSGDVELEMDGRARRPKPGEEVLIPAWTRHSVRTSDAGPSRWFYGYKSR